MSDALENLVPLADGHETDIASQTLPQEHVAQKMNMSELKGRRRALLTLLEQSQDISEKERILEDLKTNAEEMTELDGVPVLTEEVEVHVSIDDELVNAASALKEKVAQNRERIAESEIKIDRDAQDGLTSAQIEHVHNEEYLGGEHELRLIEKEEGPRDEEWDSFMRETTPTLVDQKTNEQQESVAPKVDLESGVLEQEKDVILGFEHQFGIHANDLEQVHGFHELSEGQKKLVFENLSQLTLGRVYEEAEETHNQSVNQARSQAGFFGKMWVGLKESFLGKKDVVERQKAFAANYRTGGIEVHKDQLEQLVEGMTKNGPKCVAHEDGSISVQFAEEWEDMDEQSKFVLDQFNQAAERLSQISIESTYETAPKKDRQKFAECNAQYEHARKHLVKEMRLRSSFDEAEVVLRMAKTEERVTMNRFLQTSPDAVEELKNIEDKNVWKEAGKYFLGHQGFYTSLGFLGRTVLTGVGSVVAAPLVAASIAGVRSWNKADAEMRETERNMRQGLGQENRAKVEQLRKELSVIHDRLANEKVENTRMLLVQKQEIERELASISKDGERKQNIIDATGKYGITNKLKLLSDRLDEVNQLIDEANIAPDLESPTYQNDLQVKRAKILDAIHDRVQYAEDKIRLGKMNYGTSDEMLANNYELLAALSQAKVRSMEATGNKKVEERLATLLMHREQGRSHAEFTHKVRRAAGGALMGAGFAYLGVLARDYAQEYLGIGGTGTSKAQPDGEVEQNAPTQSSSDVGQPRIVTHSEVLPSVEINEYTVGRGESLSRIISEQVPKLRELGDGKVQQMALANFLKSLTHDELESIGVRGGNANMLIEGQRIDIARARELLEAKHINGISFVEDALRRYGSSEPYDAQGHTATHVIKLPNSAKVHIPAYDEAALAVEINRGEKLELILESGTKTVFKDKPELWDMAAKMKVADFMQNRGLSTEQQLTKEIIDLQLRIRPLTELGYQPKQDETVEVFMRRVLEDMFNKNPKLNQISIEELEKMLVGEKHAVSSAMQYQSGGGEEGTASPSGLDEGIVSEVSQSGMVHVSTSQEQSPVQLAGEAAQQTDVRSAPYPNMEEQVSRVVEPAVTRAKDFYGSDADKPAAEIIASGKIFPPLQRLIDQGFRPEQNESIVGFYARVIKEQLLRTRVPVPRPGSSI